MIKLEWTNFKAIVQLKSLPIQMRELPNSYRVFINDNGVLYESSFLKESPRNSDQIDFEDNFKAGVNQQVTTKVSAVSLPLPTGAATETTLSSLNTKIPSLGQNTMANSQPVVLASNQTPIPVTGSFSAGLLPTQFYTSVANVGTTNYDIDVSGYNNLVLQTTGTWVGDIQWFASVDGVNFSIAFYGIDLLLADGQFTSLINSNAFIQLNVAGFKTIRFTRTIASGSANLTIGLKDSSSAVTAIQGTVFTNSNLRDGSGNLISSQVDLDGERHLSVSANMDGHLSTANSSTSNLASAAAFTGTAVDCLNYNLVYVYFFATQNCTIRVEKSSNGTNWDAVQAYSVTANTGSIEAFETGGQFIRIVVTNNGASATTSLRLRTVLQSGASPVPVTMKNTQQATAISTQDLKDSGRVLKTFYATFTGATTEGLVTLTPATNGTTSATGTSFSVTAGKTLRIQSISVTTRNAGAAGQGIVCQLRMSASGAITTASSILATCAAGTKLATANVTDGCTLSFADGIEVSGTQQFGVTQVGSATANNTVVITGYEY